MLLILDHPKNPGYPTHWHARGYGLFAANPLGAKVFSDGKDQLNLHAREGEERDASATCLLVLPGPFSKEKAEKAFARVHGALRVALRVGLVGCGNITDTHARAVREAGLEVAAFVGRDPAKAEAMAARHGGRAFASYEAFLDAPIDVVVIGSPSGRPRRAGHRRRAARAARARREADRRQRRARARARRGGRGGGRDARRPLPGPAQARARTARLRSCARAGSAASLLVSARVKWHRPPEYYSASRWRGTLAQDGGAALVNQGDPHRRPAAVAPRARGARAGRSPRAWCTRSRARTSRSRCCGSRRARSAPSRRRPWPGPATRAASRSAAPRARS